MLPALSVEVCANPTTDKDEGHYFLFLLLCSVQLTSRFPFTGGTDISNCAYGGLKFPTACGQAIKMVVCLQILSVIEWGAEPKIWPAAS